MLLYLIGSLRNPEVPKVAEAIRKLGFDDVFDDWWAASEDADTWWQEYEQARGRPYTEALYGRHADCVYEFDKRHLNKAGAGVLVLPAGKSGHLEAGYLIGRGKPVYALLAGEPERFDVMYRFFSGVYTSLPGLLDALGSARKEGVMSPRQVRYCQCEFCWKESEMDKTKVGVVIGIVIIAAIAILRVFGIDVPLPILPF